MDRRSFLLSSVAAASAPLIRTSSLWSQAALPAHRLPASDVHYQRTRGYVEETPVPEYHWASDAAYERFHDMKFGVRVHWGLYSIEGLPNESWPFLAKSFTDRSAYNERYKTWNPAGFDAEEWMELFEAGGAKMFSFTTKHHEGFAMYDTRARVRSRVDWAAPGGPQIVPCDLSYSIMETPFRRDVVGELCSAAHRRKMAIDLYFSHPDWYDADFRPYALHPLQTRASIEDREVQQRKRQGDIFTVARDPSPEEVSRMMLRHRAQLSELLTNYGRIDMLCLDQWFGPAVWPELRKTILHLRSLQPDVMLRARGIGNYGDYYTPERFVPGGKENSSTPWFVIYPLGTSFSYDPNPAKYKGADWIVHNLVDAAAKGGNFMVGIGPDGSGRFAPEASRQLKQAGDWLRMNGEGIYATRSRSGDLWHEGEAIRYTVSKDQRTIYAFALAWPGASLNLRTVRPRPGSSVTMLAGQTPLAWSWEAASGTTIRLPDDLQDEAHRPCSWVWGFRIAAA
jgi:alpha-L-fucosidase